MYRAMQLGASHSRGCGITRHQLEDGFGGLQ
jgi:hypothetical protein